jgi:hypothetical protein
MLKKIVVGILILSVLGAVVAVFAYQALSKDDQITSADSIPVLEQQTTGITQESQQEVDSTTPGEPQAVAQGAEGDAWQATGTIAEFDDNGLTMDLDNGESVYVELGPPDYWQTQGITFQEGQQVSVVGTINDGMIHAFEVQLPGEQILQIRNEQGQPMWSGGVSRGKGQNNGQSDGEHKPDPQAQVDEWVTINGSLIAFQGGNMTVSTPEGELISFSTGQPRFFADQGITLQVGEDLIVVGYEDNGQFVAGEITQVSTGSRVMLRDPNGRPLWAGPGNGNGNGNNGNGNGNRQAGGQS